MLQDMEFNEMKKKQQCEVYFIFSSFWEVGVLKVGTCRLVFCYKRIVLVFDDDLFQFNPK